MHIEESLHGKDDPKVITPLSFLCNVYEGSNQLDKLESCDERLIPIIEGKFGKDSARLGPSLKSEAGALRKLGRVDEAVKVEQRIQAIQTGAGQPAGNPSAQIPAN